MDRRRALALLGAGLALPPALGRAQTANLRISARNAWLYVLPLIQTASARVRMLDRKEQGPQAGLNRLSHFGRLASPADRDITTPNNDTLYSNAFLDLTGGPLTLTVPDVRDRYVSVAIMDMYSNNNFILGARSNNIIRGERMPGGPAGTYRLIGPDQAISGPNDLRLATPHGWVLSRVLVDGEADLAAARSVQARVKLIGPKTARPIAYATRDADWSEYFASAAALLAADPPDSKAGYVDYLAVRGANPAGDFKRDGYSAADAAAIDDGVRDARAFIAGVSNHLTFVHGWSYPRIDMGRFGDNYVYRAVISVLGLSALPLSEAMYMRAESEDGTWLFRGDELLRLSLPKPVPVDAFWSLTMYEATPDGQYFLTENPIKRYAIGDRTRGLKRGADGGLDIWIGRTDPGGERTANWLPAPRQGPFACFMRAYLPQMPLFDHRYYLPPIVQA